MGEDLTHLVLHLLGDEVLDEVLTHGLAIQYNTIQYNTIQYNIMQYNTKL